MSVDARSFPITGNQCQFVIAFRLPLSEHNGPMGQREVRSKPNRRVLAPAEAESQNVCTVMLHVCATSISIQIAHRFVTCRTLETEMHRSIGLSAAELSDSCRFPRCLVSRMCSELLAQLNGIYTDFRCTAILPTELLN